MFFFFLGGGGGRVLKQMVVQRESSSWTLQVTAGVYFDAQKQWYLASASVSAVPCARMFPLIQAVRKRDDGLGFRV